MELQRGAGRFYLNPTLAGHPQGTEVSFWLATDNGPLQVTLAPQESVAFIPADQVPRAQHILQGEKGFRLTPLALKDFHRQPVYGLYCRAHRQLMNYESACVKLALPSTRPMCARQNAI